MARLLTCGWESASPVEGVIQQNFTHLQIESSITRNTDSVYSMRIPAALPGANGFQYPYLGAVIADVWYARFYLYFPNAPTAALKFFAMNDGSAATWLNTAIELRLNTDQTLSLIHNNTARTPTSAVLATSTWHMVEVRGINGTSGQSELKVNGTSVVSVSGATGQTGAFAALQLGADATTNRGVDLYIDDLVLNDSNGADQNTWAGGSNLKLLTATGDSSIGTGWTTSGAATTNLYTNIDNIPPIGVADTTANEGKQIRNATSNANSAYNATLQSYSTAGLITADIINCVQALVMTASPVSTSAKQGTVGCVSNPAGTFGSLWRNANANDGQFWSGLAAGTYPSGWHSSLGPAVYGDIASGSRSTSPVVRINQVTSSTRIAMATLLGMYVDYLPGTPTASLVWKPRLGPNYRR